MPSPDDHRRWLMLGVLFLARTAMAVQFQSVGAVGPLVVESYGIDFTTLGTMVGLFMLPGVVIALPGGLLGQRYGDKPVALLGLTLMVLGGLGVAVSPSIGLALAARIVSGIGGVLVTVVLTKMLIDWFAGREIALAMALFVNSWPIGIGLTLLTLPAVASGSSPSAALLGPVGLSLCALIAVAALYHPPTTNQAQGSAIWRFRLSQREWLLAIAAGLVWMFYNVGFIVLMTFGPAFLAASGTPLAQAGPIASTAMWACAVSVPLSGLVAQRVHAPNLLMVGGFAGMAILVMLLAEGALPLVIYAVFGLAAGVPAGLIMALPSEGLKPENRVAGMGVFYAVYYAGMAGLVALAGWLKDATQVSSAPLLFSVMALLLAAISLAFFRAIQRGSTMTAAATP